MNLQNTNILPFSGGRYSVNQNGDVFNQEGDKLLIKERSGKLWVKLNWLFGEQEYELGLIALSAFGLIHHEDHLYVNIFVIYQDGDFTNCTKDNLTFVFKGMPIESSVKKGFYLIPSTVWCVIDRDGNIFNLKMQKFVNFYLSKGTPTKQPGYHFCSIKTQNGSFRTSQHRLLCLTFKSNELIERLNNGCIFRLLTVNHIDSVKSNNVLSNLEWLTYQENNDHMQAEKIKNRVEPRIYVRDLLTEVTYSFFTLRECGRWLGEDTAYYVTERLKDKSGKIYPDYKLFKRDKDEPWPEVDSSLIPEVPLGFSNSIVARNVFTGKIIFFNDLSVAKDMLGINSSVILVHARNNVLFPHQGYNFRFLINAKEWPIHPERNLEMYRLGIPSWSTGVVILDTVTNEEVFYGSLHKCSELFNINLDYLQTYLYTGRLYKKRFKFTRYYPVDNIEVKSISSKALK